MPSLWVIPTSLFSIGESALVLGSPFSHVHKRIAPPVVCFANWTIHRTLHHICLVTKKRMYVHTYPVGNKEHSPDCLDLHDQDGGMQQVGLAQSF